LLDLLRPRRVDIDLARFAGRAVHHIQFRAMNLDVADRGALENERVPLQRKIDKWCGEKWFGNFAAGFFDVDVMDLVRAAPKMQRHGGHVRAVSWNLRQLPIDVIAYPNREIDVHDQERDREHDDQPKPPTL